jgi:ABC-2 type transport system permease protein
MTLSWQRAWIVARREYLAAVKRKAFLFTLIAVPLYFGGVMMFATRGSESGRRDAMRRFTHLGVCDSSGLFQHPTLDIATRERFDLGRPNAAADTFRTAVELFPDQASLLAAVRDGRLSEGVVVPADYLASGRLRRYSQERGIFGGSGRTVSPWLTRNLITGLVDSARVERAVHPSVESTVYTLNRKTDEFAVKDNQRELLDFMVPFLFSILLGMCIITGGQYLLQGLTEEKESRILESLLCTLSADELLAGKLIGLGATGLTLVAVWLGAGMALGGPMVALVKVQLPPAVLAIGFAYFLFGYLFYGGLMTAIGAITNNMREAQQFAMMFTFANFVPFILMTRILDKPDGPFAVALSLFPPTAPTAMVMRLAAPAANVPAWQLVASLGLLALSGWLVLRAAARVFRIGLLMYGKTPNLPEILRWARSG